MSGRHKIEAVKNYPYFNKKTIIRIGSLSDSVSRSVDRYTLTGISRMSCTILDVYFTFFNSAFNQYYHQVVEAHPELATNQALCRQNLATSFNNFLKIITITALEASQTRPQIKIREDCEWSLSQESSQEGQKYRQKRRILADISCQIIAQQVRSHSIVRASSVSFEYAQKLTQKKQGIINEFIQETLNNEKLSSIKHIIPQTINTNQAAAEYLRFTFQRITNICYLFRSQKLTALKRMNSTYGNFMRMKFPVLDKEGDKDKKCDIEVGRHSEESKPVLTSLAQIIPLWSKRNRHVKIDMIKQKESLMRETLKLLGDFYRKTRTRYPALTSKDILFDQRSLKLQFDPRKLIKERLGLRGSTEHVELRLASHPTPEPIDMDSSWLQAQPRFKWELNRALHHDRTEQDKDSSSTLDSEQYLEKAHTWRTLSVLYLIYNGNPMLKTEFDKVKRPPSDIQTFKQQMWTRLLTGKITLPKLLNPQRQKIEGFDFKFKDIEKYMGIQSDRDSLVDQIHVDKVKFELRFRNILSRQILSLMTSDRYFRKLMNAKKYLIIYFVGMLEESYYLAMLTWKEKPEKGSWQRIKQGIKGPLQQIDLERERQNRQGYLSTASKKIEEYYKRKDTDSQGLFFIKNHHYYEWVQKCLDTRQRMARIEDEMDKIQASAPNQQDNKQRQAQLCLNQIQQLGHQVISVCLTALEKLMQEQLEGPYVKDENYPTKMQKIPNTGINPIHKQLPYFLFKWLLVCLKATIRLTTHNWKRIENRLHLFLYDEKAYLPLTKSSEISSAEIGGMRKNINRAEEQVCRDDKAEYYTMRLPERATMSLWDKFHVRMKDKGKEYNENSSMAVRGNMKPQHTWNIQ